MFFAVFTLTLAHTHVLSGGFWLFVGQSGRQVGRRSFLGAAVLMGRPPAQLLHAVLRFLVFVAFVASLFLFLGVCGPIPHAQSRSRTPPYSGKRPKGFLAQPFRRGGTPPGPK